MMLHGIERVCDKYWAYVGPGPKPIFLEVRADKRNIPFCGKRWGWLDLFIVRTEDYAAVLSGISGAELAGSISGFLAIQKANELLSVFKYEGMRNSLIQWLETHPLSPRYRWANEVNR